MRTTKLFYAILVIAVIFAAIGCAIPASTPSSTQTPTTTLEQTSSQDIASLEVKIKNLESKVEQISSENQNLKAKIAEINLFSDESLIPTVPFKIVIKSSLGQIELIYEIGMDSARQFQSSTKLSDSGILRIVGVKTTEVPYSIFRENNTIAIPTEIRDYYSLRLCDKNRVAMMFNGYPDVVRTYEIRLSRWDTVEQVYKW